MIYALLSLDDWIKLISGAGLGAALAIFMLWKMFQDKDADRKRLDNLEAFIHNQLMDLIKTEASLTQQCMQVIQDNTDVTQKCLNALSNYEVVLKDNHRMNMELLAQLKATRDD